MGCHRFDSASELASLANNKATPMEIFVQEETEKLLQDIRHCLRGLGYGENISEGMKKLKAISKDYRSPSATSDKVEAEWKLMKHCVGVGIDLKYRYSMTLYMNDRYTEEDVSTHRYEQCMRVPPDNNFYFFFLCFLHSRSNRGAFYQNYVPNGFLKNYPQIFR